MKLWSISTTVRNPERLRNFLRVLKLLENQYFNSENQIKYQILLIQNKLYIPTDIPNKYREFYSSIEKEMPYEVAEKIFKHQNYKDPAMRGRQSVNPLNKLGFSIAREKVGKIVITELGKQFLSLEQDIGFIFFKSLLKLQFPNPWSKDFSEENGFDVQPFIATMHLINELNKKNKNRKGLTREEFSLFVPSLINYKLIKDYVNKIIKYRNDKNKDKFIYNFAKEFYQTDEPTEKQIANFFEYGDNIMRYFRLTRYFKVTTDRFGGSWTIDLEPARKKEIEQLLDNFSGVSHKFESLQHYLEYISDIRLPELPFEDVENLKIIAKDLINNISALAKENNHPMTEDENTIINTDFYSFSKKDLNNFIEKLRDINLNIKERINKIYLTTNLENIQQFIDNLRDKKTIRDYEPERFEKLITDALRIINDELKIKPNYPVDDNGEPISHSSGNKPDIECFYVNFNLICEVTLNTSNFQWIKESQPVMRHLFEFEQKYYEKKNYCLFISPKIHIDTVYHFWTAIKYGYNNLKLKIIPLTTQQFSELLEIVLIFKRNNKRFLHTQVEELFNNIIFNTNNLNSHSDWISIIPSVINEWKNKVIKYGY